MKGIKVDKDGLKIFLLVIITLSMLFISWNISVINKELGKISKTDYSERLDSIERDLNTIKLDIGVIKDDTGWKGLIVPKNEKKEDLLDCLKRAGEEGNSTADSYSAYVLTCIGIYLAN
jgi:hypothetical protein